MERGKDKFLLKATGKKTGHRKIVGKMEKF